MTPQRSLFRQEVIDFQQQDRCWGEVVLLQTLPNRISFWLITVFVTSIVVFLFFAQYARKETVNGFLTPTTGTAKVFVSQRGVISAIRVELGQQVEKGQPLLVVTTGQISADGADINSTVLDTLTEQRASLRRQIEAENDRTRSERNRILAQIRSLEIETGEIDAQVAIQRERVRVYQDLVAAASRLSTQGYISEVEQKRRQEALLEQLQRIRSLGQQSVARQSQITEARFTLEQLPTVMDTKIQAIRSELSTIEQRIAEVNGRRAYTVRAPTSGHISMLQATVGQAADPQRPQLQIVPEDSTLQAELLVPTRAIGFVRTGQDVRLLFDAFPYQNFGTYRGRIIRVSQTVLNGSDFSGPIELREPAYKVTVALERQDVDAYQQKFALQADMLLKADIILDRRSLFSWILNPLLSARVGG